MVVTASLTGFLRTILIVVGAFTLVRFLGQLMVAKRNLETERKLNERERKLAKERQDKLTNFGKTTILGRGKSRSTKSSAVSGNAEDVDFEEVS